MDFTSTYIFSVDIFYLVLKKNSSFLLIEVECQSPGISIYTQISQLLVCYSVHNLSLIISSSNSSSHYKSMLDKGLSWIIPWLPVLFCNFSLLYVNSILYVLFSYCICYLLDTHQPTFCFSHYPPFLMLPTLFHFYSFPQFYKFVLKSMLISLFFEVVSCIFLFIDICTF